MNGRPTVKKNLFGQPVHVVEMQSEAVLPVLFTVPCSPAPDDNLHGFPGAAPHDPEHV